MIDVQYLCGCQSHLRLQLHVAAQSSHALTRYVSASRNWISECLQNRQQLRDRSSRGLVLPPNIIAPTESSSTLASVFPLKYKNVASSWSKSKLRESHTYSQLHAKYWGKSMAIEEQEWRNSQDIDAMEVDDSDPESETGPVSISGTHDHGYAKTSYGCTIFVISGMNKLLVWGLGRTGQAEIG
jgi:hypothetical protein